MTGAARAVTRLALPAAVACVVLGIFLMHGAGLHGVASPSASPVTSSVTSVSATGAVHHVDHAPPGPPAPGADADADAGPSHHDDGGGHGSGAAATCVALVTGSLAALLLLALARVGRRPHAWLVVRRWAEAPLRHLLPPAGAGPPVAWRFSVIRC